MISESAINIIKFFSTIDDISMVDIGLHHKLNINDHWTVGYDHPILYNGRLLKGSKDRFLAYIQFDGLEIFDADFHSIVRPNCFFDEFVTT